jgi:SAM-dependent methyltransferase
VSFAGAPLPLNAWLRFDGISRALRRTSGVERVLEIGPGVGAIGARLASRYRYTAVELDPEAAAIAHDRIAPLGGTVLSGDESLLPPHESFDLVCAFEVLEHVEDDGAALRSWRNRVRPGGWILLSVPAHQHRFGPHDRLVGHFRRYDRDGLDTLLAVNGFEPTESIMCGFPLGYALETARNGIGRLVSPADTMDERTAASGRWLQPSPRVGALMQAATLPFRVVQRPFCRTSLGTALVALARRA